MNYLLKHCLLLIVLLQLSTTDSAAQLGVKLSYANPLGDFGATFKKGPALDVYHYRERDDGRVNTKLGVYFTYLLPRQDTFPAYTISFGNPTKVYPGYDVYKRFFILGAYIEHSWRLVTINSFSTELGTGLMIGITHIEYYRKIETLSTETSTGSHPTAGLRTRFAFNYELNSKIKLYAEAMNQAVLKVEGLKNYSHNNFGIGVTIQFDNEDNEDDDE